MKTKNKIKVEMVVELEKSYCNFNDKDEKRWFADTMMNADNLYLFSKDAGDIFGKILSVKWKKK